MDVALILEQLLAPVPGGTGRYAAELAAALRRTASPGDQVTGWVAWRRDVRGAETANGTDATHATHANLRTLPLGRRALAAAWARGIGPTPRGDLVHAPTPLLPPRRSRPLVVTVHDAVPWTHPETLTPHGARWHRHMIERAVRHADAITVPSAATAHDLAQHVPQLDAARLHVLGAGVAPALQVAPDEQTTADVRRDLALPERYLVTVATLEPRKGLDVLIAAMARAALPGVSLVVVGQAGWGGVDLPSAASAAGLDPAKLRAVGRIGDRELGVVLREAVALVAPSRAEGFGLPLAEAMAVGLPVVCTDIPVFQEVTSGAAFTVPVDDAMALAEALEHVLADDTERARLAAAGRQRAKSFDWDVVARRAWGLYRDLASG